MNYEFENIDEKHYGARVLSLFHNPPPLIQWVPDGDLAGWSAPIRSFSTARHVAG